LPRHEQADAQAQTDGEFPRKIAIFLAAVRKLKELIRGAVALNAVKKLSAVRPLPPLAPCFARKSRYRSPGPCR